METVFFLSAGLLAYVFVGYPVLIFILSSVIRKDVKKESIEPTVSFIISAYNEASVIRAKIENTLALAYPKNKIEIIVVSDGSTDYTDDIVREYGDSVRLLHIAGRRGKTHCQNRAAEIAQGEILVFSDANSMYQADALARLVSNFADPSVGMAYGALRYSIDSVSEEPLYWNMETFLKTRENMLGICIGANGAIYAVRRESFVAPDDHVQPDLTEPFLQHTKGYRTVYDPSAICAEIPGTTRHEYVRKIRIVHGALRSVPTIGSYLNPFRRGWYAVAFLSHKVIRWYVFVPLACLYVSSAALSSKPLFLAMFLGQSLVYALALLGRFIERLPFSIPYYVVAVNTACAVATYRALRGMPVHSWETVRR